jgi:hypothetical protein
LIYFITEKNGNTRVEQTPNYPTKKRVLKTRTWSHFYQFIQPFYRRLDSNPLPYDGKVGVLPVCHRRWHILVSNFKWLFIFHRWQVAKNLNKEKLSNIQDEPWVFSSYPSLSKSLTPRNYCWCRHSRSDSNCSLTKKSLKSFNNHNSILISWNIVAYVQPLDL